MRLAKRFLFLSWTTLAIGLLLVRHLIHLVTLFPNWKALLKRLRLKCILCMARVKPGMRKVARWVWLYSVP